MRLVSIERVTSEHRLAKTIYDEKGRVLLARGSELRPEYVERFKKMGITSVYVEDDETITEVEDIVSEGIRLQVKKTTGEALAKVKAGNSIDFKMVQEAVRDIIDEVIRNRHLLVHLVDIRTKSDAALSHSVNTCVLALLTGIAMGYNQLKLKELGIGALLHDIGKAVLDETLVKNTKPPGPAEKEILRKHPDLGFEILRKTDNVSSIVAHVAWQHHEHYAGSGFPRGLKEKEIHEYARIVAVADMYDNLTTETPSRRRRLPHEAIEIIQGCQGKEFDPDIVRLFIQNIAPYPVGSKVILNSGLKGIVVEVKKDLPTRPKVKITENEKGIRVAEPYFIDLMEEYTVFVAEVERE